MKKLIALVLALAMVALCGLAFADTTPTVVIDSSNSNIDLENHTFNAYQILTSGYTGGSYVNIEWGSNMTASAFLTAVASNTTLASDFSAYNTTDNLLTATAFAETVSSYSAAKLQALIDVLTAAKVGTAAVTGLQGGASNTLPVAGYYLIIDTTDVAGTEDAANKTLLFAQNGTNEMVVKAEIPTIDKQIKDDDGTFGVVGDSQVGDTVWFKVETSVPDLSLYDSYTYTINDTMSKGLKLDTSSIKVYTSEQNTLPSSATALGDTIVTKNVSGVSSDGSANSTFSVQIVLKTAAGAKTDAGNATRLYTYYCAEVTEDAIDNSHDYYSTSNTANLTFTNTSDGSGEGTTGDKPVYDWSFTIELDKTDGTDTINGAKFVLSESSTYSGTYNATNDTVSSTTGLIGLVSESGAYRVADSASTSPIYVITAGDVDIKGLDDNTTYYLHEVKAPDGYNQLDGPVSFKIDATYSTTGDSVTTIAYTGTESADSNRIEVVNHAGTVLPSTGGIGTTIFYILGGLLVVGAAVILVARRKASN